ncbi:MAG: cupin domain-containing protein [Pseudomonadota bacterium]
MNGAALKIGEKLRRLRSSNSLTQEELANRAFLTKGFISQLERDQTSPSIATLKDILDVFGVRMDEFFKDDQQVTAVYKKANRVLTSDSTEGYSVEVLVPDAQNRRMDPVLVTLQSGEQTEAHGPHEGEEFGLVLQGRVALKVDNAAHKLGKGDCFYFSARSVHSVENCGPHAARILWVVTPPIY